MWHSINRLSEVHLQYYGVEILLNSIVYEGCDFK